MPGTACRLISMIVAALSVGPALAAEARFTCEDGARIQARFEGDPTAPGSAVLSFAESGQQVSLPQAPSADGGRYVGGDIEFWVKGQTARLTRAGKTTHCVVR
jgi:membrane-bound inhibitor of C-type lysozyme